MSIEGEKIILLKIKSEREDEETENVSWLNVRYISSTRPGPKVEMV